MKCTTSCVCLTMQYLPGKFTKANVRYSVVPMILQLVIQNSKKQTFIYVNESRFTWIIVGICNISIIFLLFSFPCSLWHFLLPLPPSLTTSHLPLPPPLPPSISVFPITTFVSSWLIVEYLPATLMRPISASEPQQRRITALQCNVMSFLSLINSRKH